MDLRGIPDEYSVKITVGEYREMTARVAELETTLRALMSDAGDVIDANTNRPITETDPAWIEAKRVLGNSPLQCPNNAKNTGMVTRRVSK